MSSNETRGGKGDAAARDRERKAQRDPNLQNGPGPSEGPSLLSRIGDKDAARMLPQAPLNSYRPDTPWKDDDRDSSRKRTISGMTSNCSNRTNLTFRLIRSR